MIAARRKKQCTRITPDSSIEAHRLGVKSVCLLQVSDMQVEMPHRRAWGCACPASLARGLKESADVYRIGRHHQLASQAAPTAARAVGVDLDAEVISVLQVEGLAHQVVPRTRPNSDLTEMPNEPAERWTVRQQDSEVVESQCSLAWRRACTRQLP
jgi:hypothetical protein